MFRLFDKTSPRVIEEPTASVKLTLETLRQSISALKEVHLSWLERRRYVYRSLSHTVAWAQSYVATESEELDSEFVSESKDYQIVLIREVDGQFLKIAFRLTTIGRDGWTEYGISIRKVGSYYACLE